MSFKVPFSMSLEEKALMDLYTLLNNELNTSVSSWSFCKEEILSTKSAKISGYISLINNGIERRSDSFTSICEDPRPKEVIVSIATIKALILCSNSLGIPIEYQFDKHKKPTEYHEVKSWKELAEDHSLESIMVAKCNTIKSLRRYCKTLNFPISQALEEVQKKFNSERVTTKQFFEFLYGESNYNKVKSTFKKRKADRRNTVVTTKEEPVETSLPKEKEVIQIVSNSRNHADSKYVIGKMISHGINSKTFAKISQSMADKYGNFQYFCINASDDEIASVLMSEE